MNRVASLALGLGFASLAACGNEEAEHGHSHDGPNAHSHGAEPAQEPEAEPAPAENDEHHDEVSLGTALFGAHEVEFAQGHGSVVAGGESHLVVKLPFNDSGATTVRAWIGSADRTLSYIGRGEYAKDHDDYNLHATAPDPLPADPLWWIELESPDGKKSLGSVEPILE